MRLLSNFDTSKEQQLLDEYKKGFGDEKVISIHKSRWYYIIHVVAPLAIFFMIFSIWLYLSYMLDLEYQHLVQRAFWICMALYLIATLVKTSREYMNRKMDYLIVTPKEVIKYDQAWVFDRETETIHVDKVKSVTVSKHGIVNSFLDIWTITFLAEGEDNKGDIIMSHIDAVEQVERKIRTITWMNTA